MEVNVIAGNIHSDHRGKVSFVNDFDMSEVVRFYTVMNEDTSIKRGWQGHQLEQKWFHCVAGSFSVTYIKIDDWRQPSKSLEINESILSEGKSEVLHIPGGYVTCLQALSEHSKLIVFSDSGLETSKNDDYRFDINYWMI